MEGTYDIDYSSLNTSSVNSRGFGQNTFKYLVGIWRKFNSKEYELCSHIIAPPEKKTINHLHNFFIYLAC